MSRVFLWLGPLLIGAFCAQAWASDVEQLTGGPGAEYLLSLGPYGALVWGAYVIGKGLKLTVQVELSARDRELLESIGRRGEGA